MTSAAGLLLIRGVNSRKLHFLIDLDGAVFCLAVKRLWNHVPIREWKLIYFWWSISKWTVNTSGQSDWLQIESIVFGLSSADKRSEFTVDAPDSEHLFSLLTFRILWKSIWCKSPRRDFEFELLFCGRLSFRIFTSFSNNTSGFSGCCQDGTVEFDASRN